VHEHDGDVVAALELAQVREQRRDLAGVVLVDAVQADERVQVRVYRARTAELVVAT
jgi:hypothetical protein